MQDLWPSVRCLTVFNNILKNRNKTLLSNLYAEGIRSPLHTFQERDGTTTVYCPGCFVEQPAGRLGKGEPIPLKHMEGCENEGS